MNKRLWHGVLFGVVFLAAGLFRWLVLDNRLSGDDHWPLWAAASFLKGDRFLLEFSEPGTPLQWLVSAAVQAAVGYRAIGEVVLGTTLVAAGIAIAFHLARQAGRSTLVAIGLTVVAILLLATAKLYSYPKIFIYPFGLWLCWRYIDRPSVGRAAALAAGVAVAFGYRHDHGAYVAAGASVAVIAAHAAQGPRAAFLRLCAVGAATVLILSPFFVLVQAREGLVDYFGQRTSLSSSFDSDGVHPPNFANDATAPLWLAIAPQRPVPVEVRWADDVNADDRVALEQRYGLASVAAAAGAWRTYLVTDTSEQNLMALASDLYVVEVDGISGRFDDGFAVDDFDSATSHVQVRWRQGLSGADLASLETKYQLDDRQAASANASGQLWRYLIRDRTTANVTALHAEPQIDALLGVHAIRLPRQVALRSRISLGPDVLVRWAASVDPAARTAAERRYRLMEGRLDDGDATKDVWQYEIADQSAENLTALVADPQVAYTDQIDKDDAGVYRTRPWTAPAGAGIRVRWDSRLRPDSRLRLEQRYHLLAPENGLTPYALGDGRPANVRSLLADPRVKATTGFDVENGRVAGESWLGGVVRSLGIFRLRPLPRLVRRDNAGPWVYYVSLTLPFLVLGVLALDRWRGRPARPGDIDPRKMLAAAVLAMVMNHYLLKRLGYVADHVDIVVILSAWLLSRAIAARPVRQVMTSAIAVLAVVLLMATTAAAVVYADVPGTIQRYRLDTPLSDQWAANRAKFRAFSTSPPVDDYAPPGSTGDRGVIRYLYECTQPEDRIWVTTDLYAIPYYTERRLVGHLFWSSGFMESPAFEERMVDLLEREPVPLIIGIGGTNGLDHLARYPRVRDYVAGRYTTQLSIPTDDASGNSIWLLLDGRRTPSGTYDALRLPCFGRAR